MLQILQAPPVVMEVIPKYITAHLQAAESAALYINKARILIHLNRRIGDLKTASTIVGLHSTPARSYFRKYFNN